MGGFMQSSGKITRKTNPYNITNEIQFTHWTTFKIIRATDIVWSTKIKCLEVLFQILICSWIVVVVVCRCMGVTDYIVWEDPTTRSSSRSLFSNTRNGPPKKTLHTYIHSYIKHTPKIADWLSLDQIGSLLASSNLAQQYAWSASGFWPWQELDTSDWKMSNSYSTIPTRITT